MLISKKTDSGISLTTAWVMEHKKVDFMEELSKILSVSFLEILISRYRFFFPGLEFLA